MELIDRTALEIRDALFTGAASCLELAERWIARTEANRALNCYVAFDAASLLRQATEADARIAAGQRMPLSVSYTHLTLPTSDLV